MKNTSKILALVLGIVMVLMSLSVVASAAKTTGDTVLYLTPNANWKQGNARYAVYTWDIGETWFSMTDSDGDGIYECTVPAGVENIIFCRMNPNTTANNWSNKWNQTGDLKYDGTNNHYTVKENTWDKGGGTWSLLEIGECVHAPTDEGTVITPATCTTDGEVSHVCSKCGETYTATLLATGHNYEGASATCGCGAVAALTVAGDNIDLFGTAWDVANTANDMKYDAETGLWSITYLNATEASVWPNFKVVLDHSWNVSWGAAAAGISGSDNAYVEVPAGHELTISFDYATKTLSMTTALPHVHAHEAVVTAPTCTAAGYTTYTCACGDTYVADEVAATGHSYADGKCSVCGEEDPDYVPALTLPTGTGLVINFSDWPEFAEKTFADGDTHKYNDFFTFIFSSKSKVDGSGKTFEDGFEATLRLSFNGSTPYGKVPNKNALMITTDKAYTLKVWYVAGGDGRYVALLDNAGEIISQGTTETTKNSMYYAELEIPAAGTYYFGNPGGNNYIFKIELAEKASEEPECTHDWSDATCEDPKTCKLCGVTDGDALGHSYYYNICLNCSAPNPHFVYNLLLPGENKVVCNQYHLVANGEGEHGFPYQFTTLTVTEAGHYAFSCDKYLGVTIYTIPVGSEGADFSTGGTSWGTFVATEADLQPGVYYIGLIYAAGEGEYNVTITRSDIHTHAHEAVVTPPTCTEAGYTTYTCSCGDTYTADEVPATGHSYADGKCSVCGADDPDYVAPEVPGDEPSDDEPTQPTIWERIINVIKSLIDKILGFFKKLF